MRKKKTMAAPKAVISAVNPVPPAAHRSACVTMYVLSENSAAASADRCLCGCVQNRLCRSTRDGAPEERRCKELFIDFYGINRYNNRQFKEKQYYLNAFQPGLNEECRSGFLLCKRAAKNGTCRVLTPSVQPNAMHKNFMRTAFACLRGALQSA